MEKSREIDFRFFFASHSCIIYIVNNTCVNFAGNLENHEMPTYENEKNCRNHFVGILCDHLKNIKSNT